MGLSGISIAFSYHAGKLLPHNHKRKVYFPGNVAVYFQSRKLVFAHLDLYSYASCPSLPDVRDYIRTVVDEILTAVQPHTVEFDCEIQNVMLPATLPPPVGGDCGMDLGAPKNGLAAVGFAYYGRGAQSVGNAVDSVRPVLTARTRPYVVLHPGHLDDARASDSAARVALAACAVERISAYNHGLMREREFAWEARSLGRIREIAA
jgi:hypothetical protein